MSLDPVYFDHVLAKVANVKVGFDADFFQALAVRPNR